MLKIVHTNCSQNEKHKEKIMLSLPKNNFKPIIYLILALATLLEVSR
jgi:hypothetical protein